MISLQNSLSNRKNTWPFTALMTAGTLMNLAALFTHDNGALVAVGCSLIAVGAAQKARMSKRKSDH